MSKNKHSLYEQKFLPWIVLNDALDVAPVAVTVDLIRVLQQRLELLLGALTLLLLLFFLALAHVDEEVVEEGLAIPALFHRLEPRVFPVLPVRKISV